MFIEIKKIKENIFNFKEFKHYRIIFWKGGSTLCLCYSVVVEARIHEEKRVICKVDLYRVGPRRKTRFSW